MVRWSTPACVPHVFHCHEATQNLDWCCLLNVRGIKDVVVVGGGGGGGGLLLGIGGGAVLPSSQNPEPTCISGQNVNTLLDLASEIHTCFCKIHFCFQPKWLKFTFMTVYPFWKPKPLGQRIPVWLIQGSPCHLAWVYVTFNKHWI